MIWESKQKATKPFNDLKVPAHILPYVSSFSRKIFPTSLSIHTLIYNNCFSFLLTETIFQNLSKCHDELFPGFDLFLLFIPMFVFCLFFSCLFMGLFCRWRDVEPVIWVRGPNSHLSIAIYIVILSNIFEPWFLNCKTGLGFTMEVFEHPVGFLWQPCELLWRTSVTWKPAFCSCRMVYLRAGTI